MADNKPNDTTNRVTPQQVDGDRRDSGGASQNNRAKGDDKSSGRLRPSDTTVEADGGDQAGVAGGSIDRNVSGRGGDGR